MRTLDRLKLRLQSLFRRNRLDQELDEELRYHVEELTRQHVQRGMDPARARAAALRQFGGVSHTQEDCREQRRTRWAEDFAADLRFGARLLAKSPGFTAVALLSLALGIGANTAIFTMLEAVILRELPVHEPGALVQIVGVVPGRPGDQNSFSYVNFLFLLERTPMFSSLLTWDTRRIEAGVGENMEWVSVHRVSEEYFSGLGVTPELGRALADERGNPAVAIISFDWWQKRYQGDRAVLGRSMRLGGLPFTIVGVAPDGFYGPVVGAAPDVFIPIVSDRLTDPQSKALSARNSSWLPLLARLAPGVNREQAAAGLPLVWEAMMQETAPLDRQGKIAAWFGKLKAAVQPASTGVSPMRRRFRQPLWILVAVVAVVLLIACVNLSNLLLARSLARQPEVALRLAIGASRGRLLRQFVAESLLLSAAGAALGLVFAMWSSRALISFLSTSRDTIHLDLGPNLSLLGYTAAITIVTMLLFGLAPAARALRMSLHDRLKEGSRQSTGPRASSRGLLVAQVALSLLLVTGAALFLRTFANLLAVDLGFDADRVLIASVEPGRAGFKDDASAGFYRDLQTRLRAMPGVESVSLSWGTPIQNCCWWDVLAAEGYTPGPGEKIDVYLNSVAPEFFATMGTRLVRGRDFDGRDTSSGRRVAIVNDAYAKRFFPRGDAIGRIVSLPAAYKMGPMEIVGIVENARYIDLRGPTRLAAYFPIEQTHEKQSMTEVLVRTKGPPPAMAGAVRAQVHAFHPAVPVRFRTLAQEIDGVLRFERLLALLSSFFGAVALALAAIGLYGIVAYSVTRRTSEIGIRVALGASRGSVLWLVMGQSLMLVAGGLAIGCGAAMYLARFVQTMLFGVKPADPLTFAMAAGVLGVVAVLAAWLPALAATKVDPMRALRYE